MKNFTRIFLAAFFTHMLAFHANAQFTYLASNAQNTTGSFIDIGASGSAITVANTDDATSAPLPIGFTFDFNGQSFTQFRFNTNGFIKLGTQAPSTDALFFATSATYVGGFIKSTDTADVNMIGPLNHDLEPAVGSSDNFRYVTTGTAPNRILTVQWKNVKDKTIPTRDTQFASFSFQIKMYEGSNIIEFVYGTFTPFSTGSSVFKSFAGGLKGSSYTAGNYLYIFKASTALASAVSFYNDEGASPNANQFNIQKAFPIDSGRLFRFVPLFSNDANVLDIYSMGKLAIPAVSSNKVIGLIRNSGTAAITNRKVYLSVRGANPFSDSATIASLASNTNQQVEFTPYPVTQTGTDTIEVYLPDDDFNLNNTRIFRQVVNNDEFYMCEVGTSNSNQVGYGAGTTSGFYVRYPVDSAVVVTSVKAYIARGSTSQSIGNTVYAVIMNATGTVLGSSAPVVLDLTNTNTFVDFPISYNVTPFPVFMGGQAFFAGIIQTASFNNVAYFPMGFQNEVPTRNNSPYYGGVPGTTPTQQTTSNRRFMIEAEVADPFAPNRISNFNLLGPVNQSSVTLSGASSTTLDFSWTKAIDSAGGNLLNRWLFDIDDQSLYTNALLSNFSALGGTDSTYSITYGELDATLDLLGIPVGAPLDYYWTVRATSGVNFMYPQDTFQVTITRGALVFPLCIPGNTNNTNDFIDSFYIEGVSSSIANKTGRNLPNQYLDFSSTLGVQMNAGGSYPFTMQMGVSPYTYGGAVYIDWDQNNFFSSTEVYRTNSATGDTLLGQAAVLNGTVLVPASQANGIYRMRAIAGDTVGGASLQPCLVTYGDVEDYGVSIGGPFGFSVIKFENNMTVYPNPAQGQVFVGFDFDRSRNLNVTMFNSVGAVVKTEILNNVQSGARGIDIANLAPGVYMLQLATDDGERTVKRVVIE